MTPKTKKILKWSLGIAGVLGLLTTAYFVFIKPNQNPDKDGKADDFTEPGNTASGATAGLGNPATDSIMGHCGAVKTDYDGDFDYVKCNGNIWYTRSKPNGGRPNVYPNWVSLANNALATQKLNTKYPNG